MVDAALFDLDGTLTESGEGIIKSVQYALEKVGHPEPDAEKLRVFIGPPLIDQFMSYSGLDRDTAHQALAYYRERYSTIGLFENRPYPGVVEMLGRLSSAGMRLAVASSKPEPFVLRIVEHFGMSNFFDEIVGSTMDEKRTHKSEVIDEALARLGMMEKKDHVAMVGDREHDVMGAREAGVRCIAVSYGYGTVGELRAAHPEAIISSASELADYLLGMQ